MRKLATSIITLVMILSITTLVVEVDANENVFTDVPEDHFAIEEIYHFVDEGVIRGYGDGKFGPNDNLTREQAAVILTRMLDLETSDSDDVEKHFDDVKSSSKNASKIVAISEAGIMTGQDGKFNPYDNLSREQMATILVRGLSLQDNDNQANIHLENVSKAHKNNVQTIANLGITNQLDNYRPGEDVTRAQFVAMLARATDSEESISDLLKEVYANELALESYDLEANVNLGLTLPDLGLGEESPEIDLITEMLEDIQIDMTGSYQKNPMLMEVMVDVTMKMDPQMTTTISMPMIMSEDVIWMKFPQMPGEELPEGMKDKFIEIDLNELDVEGQPTVDMETQIEFAQSIQDIFIKHFADDYYAKIDKGSYEVPGDIDANQVVKFDLTNEDLEPFVETLLTGFLPEFFDLMQDPEYADAMGLTVEEIKQAQEEFAVITEDIDEITSMLDEVLQINLFEEYIAINDQNIIVSDELNLDADITVDQDIFGFTLTSNQMKKNINGDVDINIPSQDETISFEDLIELIDEGIEEID